METPEIIPAWDSWRIVLNPTEPIAKVVTDEGVTGYGMGGECEVARDVIAPALKGEELEHVDDIENIWEKVEKLVPDESTRNSGMGGIDVALWDVVGKASNKSISSLLGRRQDKLKVYSSAGLIYRDPQRNIDEAKSFRDGEYGFIAYKFKTAHGPVNDVRTVRLIRKPLGTSSR